MSEVSSQLGRDDGDPTDLRNARNLSSDSGFLEAAAHSKDGLWTEQDTFVSQKIEE